MWAIFVFATNFIGICPVPRAMYLSHTVCHALGYGANSNIISDEKTLKTLKGKTENYSGVCGFWLVFASFRHLWVNTPMNPS